jgi:hypothetical protein
VDQSPYILKQAENLSQTFARMAQLPAHRLAGHAANLDFWKAEFTQCMASLTGYPHRIRRMKEATNQYLKQRPVADPDLPMDMDHLHVLKPDTRTTPAIRDSDLEVVMRQLRASTTRFVEACLRADVITEDQAESFLAPPALP